MEKENLRVEVWRHPHQENNLSRLREERKRTYEERSNETNPCIASDRFDTAKETTHFVVLADDKIIGALRSIAEKGKNTRLEGLFPGLTEKLEGLREQKARIVEISRFFVVKEKGRHGPEIQRMLATSVFNYARRISATHIIMAVKPARARLYVRAFGFKELGVAAYHPEHEAEETILIRAL